MTRHEPLPFDPNAPVHDPLLGTVIGGRYEVLRVLGEGGMGIVYEARQTALRRRVAIKCLHAAFTRKPDVVARFQQEALAATSVRNPHVVEILDLGRLPDGALFIAMEFLEGQELSRLLRGKTLPAGRAVRIAMQLCDALIDVHAQGIVHRDLKPDNIFLTRSGSQEDFVKILDFGISKVKRPDDEGIAELTATQAMLGTPSYMAPEQFGGARHVDARADLYAVGGVLYRALAGRTPFPEKDIHALAIKLLHSPPPDLAGLRGDLPEALVSLIHQCLSKRPEERPQSALALRVALSPFAALDQSPDAPRPTTEHFTEPLESFIPSPASVPAVQRTAPAPTPHSPMPSAAPTPPSVSPTVPNAQPTPTPIIVQTSNAGGLMVLVAVLATLLVVGALGIAAAVAYDRAQRQMSTPPPAPVTAPAARPNEPTPSPTVAPAPTVAPTPQNSVIRPTTQPTARPPVVVQRPPTRPAVQAPQPIELPPPSRPAQAPEAPPPSQPSGVGLVHSAPGNPF